MSGKKISPGNFGYNKSFHSFAADFVEMEIQERIALKAHELFIRYGFRSISMDEIAASLGISKKTIYQFYEDKNALVNSVVDIIVNDNTQECALYHKAAGNPVEEILKATDLLLDMLKEFNPSIFYDLRKYHPEAYRKLTEHRDKFIYHLIRENIVQGVKMELYRAEINPDMMAHFRLASVFMLFDPDLFPVMKFPLDSLLKEVTMNFLYGLVTPNGIKLIEKYKKENTNKSTTHDTNP